MIFKDRYNGMFSRDEQLMRQSMSYSSGELAKIRDVVSKVGSDGEYLVIAVNPRRNSVILNDGSAEDVSDLVLLRRRIYSGN